MHTWFMPFCRWLQNTSVAVWIAGSDWAYPFVQLTHLTGLSLWIGTTIALDLHLMGVGERRRPPAQFSDALFVWNWIGLATAVLGGFLLFSVEATTFIVNPAFRLKLGILIPRELILHIVVQRKTPGWSEVPEPPALAKFVGLTELLVWLAVATLAVSIPHFSQRDSMPLDSVDSTWSMQRL